MLRPGDRLLEPDQSQVTVISSVREEHPDGLTVYNFEVAGLHDYFVSATATDSLVLSHNMCRKTGGGVDLNLKYKPGWTDAQRAAADAKAAALTNADTVVTVPKRSGTMQSRYRNEQGLGRGTDADHTVDLQLGGTDTLSNMSGLDSSVNRSLGSQINHQIKDLPSGTRINNVTMSDP